MLLLLSSISTSTISMITNPGLPQFGSSVVVGLIVLLSLKEVLPASEYWNKSIESSLNLPILPLLATFAAIVVYKTIEALA